MPRCSLGSGTSVRVASVSNQTLATEHGVLQPDTNDFRRIDHSRVNQIDIDAFCGVEPEVAFAFAHYVEHDAVVRGGIDRDLPRRSFEGTLEGQRRVIIPAWGNAPGTMERRNPSPRGGTTVVPPFQGLMKQ